MAQSLVKIADKKGWLDRGIHINYDVLDANREPYSLKKLKKSTI